MEALECAKKLGIREFCDNNNIDEFFLSNLSYKNVLDLIHSPYHLNLPPEDEKQLESLCMDIIDNNPAKFFEYNLPRISLKSICRVLRSNNLKISEINLFEYIVK